MIEQTLDALLGRLDEDVEELGWDLPAQLWWVSADPGDDGLRLAARPADVLDGNPVCALLRACPEVPADDVGVVLCTEAWSRLEGTDGPVETRISQLVLRDGTEASVLRERGRAPYRSAPAPGSLSTGLLRRCAGRPSGLPLPADDLGVRLVLLWQTTSLLAAQDRGALLPRCRDDEWGRFVVPGLGAPTEPRQPWWGPTERWARGDRDPAAFAGALRTCAREGVPCLPAAFAVVRGDDEAVLSARSLHWLDDAAVCAVVDDAVPSLGEVVDRAMDTLGTPQLASLLAWVNAQPG